MATVLIDNIISDIYAAAAGRMEWRIPLSSLAQYFDLWCVQVAGADKKGGTLLFSFEGGPFPPEAILHYLRDYHKVNPRVGASLSLPPSGWFHDHEHFDEEFVSKSPFYQDYLIPYGGRFCSITKVVDNEDTGAFLVAMRGHGKQPLNAEEIEILTRVKFHMEHAMENYLHMRNAYAEIGVGKQVLNEFRHPMLLVDEGQGIWFRNHAAEKALAQCDYIFASNDILRCRSLADGNELLLAIRSLGLNAIDELSDSLCNRAFVRMRKASDGRPVAVFVIAIRPKGVMGAFGHSPLALLIFHDPDMEAELDPFIVAETFGLTPAESRVAVNLVKGYSVKEIAREIGVCPTTIKSQLQSIYTKTGTKRQAELCTLLASTQVITAGGSGPGFP